MKISKDIQLATQQLLAQLKKSDNTAENANVLEGSKKPNPENIAQGALNDRGFSQSTQQALALVKASGYPTDSKTVKAVSEFMDKTAGTTEEKLEALSVALNKEIPLSALALNALRISRTGSLADYLRPNSPAPKVQVNRQQAAVVKAHESRANEVSNAPISEAIDASLALSKEQQMQQLLEQVDALLNGIFEDLSTEYGDKPVITVDKSGIFLDSTGISGHEAVDKDNQHTPNIFENTQLQTNLHNGVDQGSNFAKGTLSAEKKHRHSDEQEVVLDDFDAHHSEILEANPEEGILEQQVDQFSFETIEALQGILEQIAHENAGAVALSSHGRMVIEQTITPHLLAVKHQFQGTIKQISSQLERIFSDQPNQVGLNKLGYQTERISSEDKLKQLDRLVDQLDQVVMKSEASLYMSMKSEKRLITISTEIDQIKQLLMRGQLEKAQSEVKSVVENLKNLTLEPTLKKVLGLPSYPNDANIEDTMLRYQEGVNHFAAGEKSSTGILQWIRRLGLNFEPELYQKAFGERMGKLPESINSNFDQMPTSLKEKLLKLAGMPGALENSTSESNVKEAIQHLTGQQLNNKIGDKPLLQQLNFAIPVSVQGHVEEMKVWIQTPQAHLKADWKNFDMFFMLKTQSIGDIGIKVRSVDLKLAVEVINDHVEKEALFMPLVKTLMEEIGDFGFTATRVSFSGWHQKKPDVASFEEIGKDNQTESTLSETVEEKGHLERGFDVKI